MLKNEHAGLTRARSASLPHEILQQKTKRPVPVLKLAEKPAAVVETKSATHSTRPPVAVTAAHEVPLREIEPRAPLVPAETTHATAAVRPRALSVGTQNTTNPSPARTAAEVTTVATRSPQRQADLQRLLVGTAVDKLMTDSGIQVQDLDKKPGLHSLLSDTLHTASDGANIAGFLQEMASLPEAVQFPASQLSFLYERRTSLTGRQGLKEFLVTRLSGAEDVAALSDFMGKLQGTAALNLPADRLAQVYLRRADVLDNPGLKDFLIGAHAAHEDSKALDDFVTDSHNGPAAKLTAPQLEFLFKQRTNLQDKPGLKDFVIAALGGGEAVSDVEGFLAESKDGRVAQFDKDQAGYLYNKRVQVLREAGLKALVIDKLVSTTDWRPGLDRFLSAIEKTKTDKLTSEQFEYLYGLRDDLKTVVSDRPGPSQKTTVVELALSRMSDQSIPYSQAKEEIAALKTFGYKGALLDFARTKAATRGAEQLKQGLANVDADQAKAVELAKKQIEAEKAPKKPEGEAPTPSGSGKERRRAEAALKTWNADKAAYEKFMADEFPVLVKTETQRIRVTYDPERARLKQDAEANFVAPELLKYENFVGGTGFHADAEWALRAADGNIEQAKILFDTCHDLPELKMFGEWAAKNNYAGQKLDAVLKVARDLNLGADKAQAVAPYLAECTDPATKQWLQQRAPAKSANDLTFEVGLLKAHTPETLSLAVAAIEAAPGKDVLTKYNKYLAKRDLGVQLLRLMQDGSTKAGAVTKVVNAYADGIGLEPFLRAANPLPAGYASLAEICAQVKEDPHAKAGNSIDRVTFAIREAASHGVGKPYIEHILTRFRENSDLTSANITDHNIGFQEWLLVSGAPWGAVGVETKKYGAGWTGIFKLNINGTDIEVHNHFEKGAQYSLHLKHGKGSFDRGPELDPKKDVSVYKKISQGCLNAYTAWVGARKFDKYTI